MNNLTIPQIINSIRKPRLFLLSLLDTLTLDELNTIPQGFNNNIIWNAGHIIAAQQGVCYRRAGLPMLVSEDFFMAYKPESKPMEPVTADDVAQIRELLQSTINQLEADYNAGLFANYPTWQTRYGGLQIASIEQAIAFLPFHEGMHLGYTLALKRLITTNK